MALVIGNVEQIRLARFLLKLVTGAAVIRLVHLFQPVRRLFLEVELAIGKRLSKHGILLGVLAAHLEHVDDAFLVP